METAVASTQRSMASAPTLSARLRLAVVRLNRRLRAQHPAESVTLTQISAMSTLHKCGAMTPGTLAEKEGVQPPSMTRVIAAMEKAGYVDRSAHPTDSRKAIVQLTAAGAAYLDATITAREAWLDERLARLTAAERDALAEAADIIQRIAED